MSPAPGGSGGAFRLEIINADRLLRVLTAGGAAAAHVVPTALLETANEVFRASQRQCPVDSGALRASGSVGTASSSPGGTSIDIAYGGAAAPYALYVHENLSARHNSPTKAKYLEDPIVQGGDDFGDEIADRIEDIMGSTR